MYLVSCCRSIHPNHFTCDCLHITQVTLADLAVLLGPLGSALESIPGVEGALAAISIRSAFLLVQPATSRVDATEEGPKLMQAGVHASVAAGTTIITGAQCIGK